MDDTQDLTTLSIRMLIFVVIALIFFFVLRGKKEEK
jgi:protein-S-isoprenylcysteine O-methyltransferase Ste14